MDRPPRYLPERSFPERAYVPGRGSPPSRAQDTPAAYLPDDRWIEHEAYLWGVDLYNAGYCWEAHEAWEAAWREAERDPVQHAFLQGLIQCAAACLKGVMGDAESARSLAARGLARLERVRDETSALYMGLDLAQLVPAFRAFVEADPTAVARRPLLWLATELPIDGELDLHAFRPAEVGALVNSYLDACQERGLTEVRIVHGKGEGALRRTVHAQLERREDVLEHRLAPPERGGWGATIVRLRPRAAPGPAASTLRSEPVPVSSSPPPSMRRARLARRARWVIGVIALGGILYRMAQLFR